MSIDLRIVGVFIRRQIVPSRYCNRSRDEKNQDDEYEISPAPRS
jgi:hypothetical protein